jgi:hypothetical protein
MFATNQVNIGPFVEVEESLSAEEVERIREENVKALVSNRCDPVLHNFVILLHPFLSWDQL